MNKKETGMLLDEISVYYPAFILQQTQDARTVRDKWHKVLEDTPYIDAIRLLEAYAGNSENKYAPHPGALKPVKTDVDRFYEEMKRRGPSVLSEWELSRKLAVPPTNEQRRRVREYGR